MKKDLEKLDLKLLSKQRILFRAFFINVIFVLITWLLLLIPACMYFAVWMTGIPPMMLQMSMMGALALWDILAVLIFLVPAIAIYWERKSMLK